MRLRFLRDRLWTLPEERRVSIAYKGGTEKTVRRVWGEQMVSDGDAEEVTHFRRPSGGAA